MEARFLPADLDGLCDTDLSIRFQTSTKPRQEQAEVIHIAGAQRIDGLRYVLPPEAYRKNIPVKVMPPVGAPAVSPSLELWNPQWPDLYWGTQTKIDADGWYVPDLPERELYNVFARADGSDGKFPCAGPKAVIASTSMQPIVLVLDGSQGSCFDKHIIEVPHHNVGTQT